MLFIGLILINPFIHVPNMEEAQVLLQLDTLVITVDNYEELAGWRDSVMASDDYETLMLTVAENRDTWVAYSFGLDMFYPPSWQYEVYLDSLPDFLVQLPHVRNLNLAYTGISRLPEDLSQLTSLERLDLSCNYFDLDEELPKLLALPNLRSLAVFGYEITPTHREMIREMNPELKVYYTLEDAKEYYQLKEK